MLRQIFLFTYLAYDSRRLGEGKDKFNEKYYSNYLGAYKPVNDYLKEYLDDPSSLEISKSFFIGANSDKSFEIKTTLRAKNRFGAMIVDTNNCNVDMNGNVTNVEMNK